MTFIDPTLYKVVCPHCGSVTETVADRKKLDEKGLWHTFACTYHDYNNRFCVGANELVEVDRETLQRRLI